MHISHIWNMNSTSAVTSLYDTYASTAYRIRRSVGNWEFILPWYQVLVLEYLCFVQNGTIVVRTWEPPTISYAWKLEGASIWYRMSVVCHVVMSHRPWNTMTRWLSVTSWEYEHTTRGFQFIVLVDLVLPVLIIGTVCIPCTPRFEYVCIQYVYSSVVYFIRVVYYWKTSTLYRTIGARSSHLVVAPWHYARMTSGHQQRRT